MISCFVCRNAPNHPGYLICYQQLSEDLILLVLNCIRNDPLLSLGLHRTPPFHQSEFAFKRRKAQKSDIFLYLNCEITSKCSKAVVGIGLLDSNAVLVA